MIVIVKINKEALFCREVFLLSLAGQGGCSARRFKPIYKRIE